jgi:hypothetical protein
VLWRTVKWLAVAVLGIELLSFAVITTSNLVIYGHLREGPRAVYDAYSLFQMPDGFRPTAHVAPVASKPELGRLIWFFGGSTMRASNDPEDKAIPSFLMATLNAEDAPYRFDGINFGINSYNSLLEVKLLEKEFIEAEKRPNLVVFYDGANDANYFAVQKNRYAHEGRERVKGVIESYYRSGFGLLKPFNAAYYASFTRELLQKLFYIVREVDPNSPELAAFVDVTVKRYDFINHLCASYGIPFVLFWQPLYWTETCHDVQRKWRQRKRPPSSGQGVSPCARHFMLVYGALEKALADKPYFVPMRNACARVPVLSTPPTACIIPSRDARPSRRHAPDPACAPVPQTDARKRRSAMKRLVVFALAGLCVLGLTTHGLAQGLKERSLSDAPTEPAPAPPAQVTPVQTRPSRPANRWPRNPSAAVQPAAQPPAVQPPAPTRRPGAPVPPPRVPASVGKHADHGSTNLSPAAATRRHPPLPRKPTTGMRSRGRSWAFLKAVPGIGPGRGPGLPGQRATHRLHQGQRGRRSLDRGLPVRLRYPLSQGPAAGAGLLAKPSVGFDLGVNVVKVFTLITTCTRRTPFSSVFRPWTGSIFLIGGFGMNYQRSGPYTWRRSGSASGCAWEPTSATSITPATNPSTPSDSMAGEDFPPPVFFVHHRCDVGPWARAAASWRRRIRHDRSCSAMIHLFRTASLHAQQGAMPGHAF